MLVDAPKMLAICGYNSMDSTGRPTIRNDELNFWVERRSILSLRRQGLPNQIRGTANRGVTGVARFMSDRLVTLHSPHLHRVEIYNSAIVLSPSAS